MAVWTSTSIVRAHVRLLWQIRVEQRTQENNSSPEVTCVPTEPHTHLLERLDRDEPLPNKLGVQTPRERDQRPNTWLRWKYRCRHCCLHSFIHHTHTGEVQFSAMGAQTALDVATT